MSDHIESIDRLSSLHDSILTRILSFLPTKDSIRTSFLAKRYRHTWASVRALRFNLYSRSDVDLVDRALARISPPKLTTFCIVSEENPNLGRIDGDRVLAWVDYAVAHNVRRLQLRLTAEIRSIDALYRCQFLKSLDLDGLILHPFPFPDPSAPILPKLRILRLRLRLDDPSNWIGKLVSSCCQLEDLHLAAAYSDNFVISAPKLRRLVLGLSGASEVRLSCPRLEYFMFVAQGEPLRKFQGDMPSLRKATTALSQGCWSQTLRSFNNAAELYLRSCFNFKVSGDILEELDKFLPSFYNLRTLRLHACFHYDSVKFMVYMLEKSPELSFLKIFVEPTCRCVDKRKPRISRKLPSNILDNLKSVCIVKGGRQSIINKSEFVKFLSIIVSGWNKEFKRISRGIILCHSDWEELEKKHRGFSSRVFLVSGDLLEELDKFLPSFYNLRTLRLHASFHYDSVKFMVYMLEKSPELSFLKIFVEPTCRCVDKRKTWISRKLPSDILDDLKSVCIVKGGRQSIINKSEFVRFLSINRNHFMSLGLG